MHRSMPAALAAALGLALLAPASAEAATDPATAGTTPLATVQVDGVVWAQVVVGDRVYATGEFRNARPAGAAPGTSLTKRSNILAYSITTGKLITSWAPSLNAEGRTITASPDGKRIYVGGSFTRVNRTDRNRIAAIDAKTGYVVQGFKAATNSTVSALATSASGRTIYAGGSFTSARGQSRQRLAAFTAGSGAVTTWAPSADRQVLALAPLAGRGKVVVGGKFARLNGSAQPGFGAVSASTGGTLSWPANQIVRNSGSEAAIGSLVAYGTGVFATGWAFQSSSNFESAVRTDLDGNLVWVSGCRGDTYGAYPRQGVLYTVGHAHDCASVPGGFSEREPGQPLYRRGVAFTIAVRGTNGWAADNSFLGRPAPKLLSSWLPALAAGGYTGMSQAAWSITGDARYVVIGGEFPSVGGRAQQGLARFKLP